MIMFFFISILIHRATSACKYPDITDPSDFTLFLEVRNREYADCSQVKGQLTIPANCPLIGDEAFQNCVQLYGNLIFESNMDKIGERAFENTNFLRVIYKGNKELNCTIESFPDCLPIYVSESYQSTQLCQRDVIVSDNLTELISQPIIEITDLPNPTVTNTFFEELTSTLTMTEKIPEMTATPMQTLSKCKHPEIDDVKKIEVKNNNIDDDEFAFCSQIKGQLMLPNNLVSIGSSAFKECSGLSDNLQIPSGVESIRDNAFDGCVNLNGNLVIDSELKELGKEAFRLTNFSQIVYKGKNEPSCGENPFPENQVVHVSSEYKKDTFCGYPVVLIADESLPFESQGTDFFKPISHTESKEISPTPRDSQRKKKLSSGAVIGIIVACIVFVIAVVAFLIYFFSIRRKSPLEEQLTSNTLTDINEVIEEK